MDKDGPVIELQEIVKLPPELGEEVNLFIVY